LKYIQGFMNKINLKRLFCFVPFYRHVTYTKNSLSRGYIRRPNPEGTFLVVMPWHASRDHY